ncbi:MAG: hypothetical protein LIO77_11085 [Rikenellaceae bacterium]|nr:hypothetical protein [Rikenellaceae bacterium]
MKKLYLTAVLLSVFAAGCILTACGGGDSGHPAARIEVSIWKAIGKGKPEKAAEIIKKHAWGERLRRFDYDDILDDAKMVVALINYQDQAIKKVEVHSVETDKEYVDDGYTEDATVTIKITLKNKEVWYSREIYSLKDNGKWERTDPSFELIEEKNL